MEGSERKTKLQSVVLNRPLPRANSYSRVTGRELLIHRRNGGQTRGGGVKFIPGHNSGQKGRGGGGRTKFI